MRENDYDTDRTWCDSVLYNLRYQLSIRIQRLKKKRVHKPLCIADIFWIQCRLELSFSIFPNMRLGQIMARRALTTEDLAAVRKLAKEFGKVIGKRAFGEDGPGLDVDLTMMETIAVEAAQGITEGTVESLLQQQTGQLPKCHPCPMCQRPCVSREGMRTIVVQGAAVEHREPVCYCSSCRREFFPPTGQSETG
jgi:hypothetical protein